MLNVTYCVTNEYDDYFTICVSKKQYEIINQFIQIFNENVENINIKILKIEQNDYITGNIDTIY